MQAGLSFRPVFPWLIDRIFGKAAKKSEYFVLKSNEAEKIDPRTCSFLICRTGGVWITQEGDAEDHGLEQGQGFRPRRRGGIVVWALTDSLIEVRGRREYVAENG